MSKTTSALLVKFVLTLGAAWLAFSLFGYNTFAVIFMIAIAGTVLNYMIGDLVILPKFGNIIASLGDGGLSILTAYALGSFIYGFRATTTSYVVFGVIVTIAEFFFHRYLLKSDEAAPNTKTNIPNRTESNFNMEIGTEFDFQNKYEDNPDNFNNDINNV